MESEGQNLQPAVSAETEQESSDNLESEAEYHSRSDEEEEDEEHEAYDTSQEDDEDDEDDSGLITISPREFQMILARGHFSQRHRNPTAKFRKLEDVPPQALQHNLAYTINKATSGLNKRRRCEAVSAQDASHFQGSIRTR